MTGFGRGECVCRGIRYSVEISTVNRRNAELVFNLPRELASFENALREQIAPQLARGRATVTAALSAGRATRPLLDHGLFRRLHDELAGLQRSLKIPGAPTLGDVVRIYAATAREATGGETPDAGSLTKASSQALRNLDTMRTREGAHLARELRRLLTCFARHVTAIRKLAPEVARKHREAMKVRLAGVDPAFAADDERLARELALFADRSDITEELSRLESHLEQFRVGLGPGEAAGRALDFLAQEMFRECNTIGAKANSAAVAQNVIAAKTELERLREQVQNVE
ncbi:MAG: YicC/YloC family endoribonuclease [Chthoniobacterales bacterium]